MVRYRGADTIQLTGNGAVPLPRIDFVLVTLPRENIAELPRVRAREGLPSVAVREVWRERNQIKNTGGSIRS
jgi:hypothetical protein